MEIAYRFTPKEINLKNQNLFQKKMLLVFLAHYFQKYPF